MPQHVNNTHCIVGKLVLSKGLEDMIDGIRTGGRGIMKGTIFTHSGQTAAWPTFHFSILVCLTVDVIRNTNFHRKDTDLKMKTPLHKHMGVGCSG